MRLTIPGLGALALIAAADPAGAQLVRGRVVETGYGYPIAFATVTVVDDTGLPAGYTQSDAFGEFQVQLQRPGRFIVRAERAGYEPASSGLSDVETGGVAYRLLVMRPGDEGLDAAPGLGFLPRALFPGGAAPATDTRPATDRAPVPATDASPAPTRDAGNRPRPEARPAGENEGAVRDPARPRREPRVARPANPVGGGRVSRPPGAP